MKNKSSIPRPASVEPVQPSPNSGTSYWNQQEARQGVREAMNASANESAAPRKKAVALTYNPEQGDAPVVVAKGHGQIAERILDKAKESGVPIQEDASLVEVLSKLDIDQQIPPALYQLVAEVLSFVYKADQRADKGGINRRS